MYWTKIDRRDTRNSWQDSFLMDFISQSLCILTITVLKKGINEVLHSRKVTRNKTSKRETLRDRLACMSKLTLSYIYSFPPAMMNECSNSYVLLLFCYFLECFLSSPFPFSSLFLKIDWLQSPYAHIHTCQRYAITGNLRGSEWRTVIKLIICSRFLQRSFFNFYICSPICSLTGDIIHKVALITILTIIPSFRPISCAAVIPQDDSWRTTRCKRSRSEKN